MSYSVLFRQFPLDRLDALAPVVHAACGGTDFDARAKIRRGWGFLERDATGETAQHLTGAIPDCVAIDNAELKQLAKPHPMKGFMFTETGIVPDGASEIAFDDVAIVAVGGLTEEIVHRETTGNSMSAGTMAIGLGVFLVTGIPPGLLGGKKKEVKPVKSNRWITFGSLITRRGEQFAMAFDHFNFAGLGAKKQLQTIANLRVLIAELEQRTPARLNLGARLVLAGQSPSSANYTSLTDYETELLWLLNAPG